MVRANRGAILVSVFASIFFLSTDVHAQKSRVDPLSESALSGALRSSDAASRDARLTSARRELQQLAAAAPASYSKASVVTRRGYSAAEIQSIASQNDLEVIRVEAKVPIADGEVFTFSFGTRSLEQVDGELAARISHAVTQARRNFENLALTEKNGGKANRFRQVAQGSFTFYKVEAIASNDTLRQLGNDPTVLAVLPAPEATATEELRALAAFRQERRLERGASAATGSRAISTDLISPCQPTDSIPTDGVAGANRVTTARPSPCPITPEPPAPPAPPPPPSAPPPVTGVQVVDSGFNGAQQFVNSYVDTTPMEKSGVPIANLLACNSSSESNKCPNDFTYTTRGNTGGSSAWGVGLGVYGGSGYRYQCGWYYVPYYDYGYRWEWQCYWVEVQLRTTSVGGVSSAFKFGGLSKAIPVAPGSSDTRNYRVSNFAWSGDPIAYDGNFAVCSPYRGYGQPDAPCGSQTVNGNFVLGATGFEDKILIPNPSCTLLIRAGTLSDANNGCYIADAWVSNLPAAYLDTTALDTRWPFETSKFVASVGSADGKLLRTAPEIPPGATQKMSNSALDYYWAIAFWAYGSNNVVGMSARHLQAVTFYDATADVCRTGTGNAPPYGPAACMFNVDISIVGPDQFFR